MGLRGSCGGFSLGFLNLICSLRYNKWLFFSVWQRLCLFFQVLGRKQNFLEANETTGEFPIIKTKALKRGGRLPGWKDTLNRGRLKTSGWKHASGLPARPSLKCEVSVRWPQNCLGMPGDWWPFSSSQGPRAAVTKPPEESSATPGPGISPHATLNHQTSLGSGHFRAVWAGQDWHHSQ